MIKENGKEYSLRYEDFAAPYVNVFDPKSKMAADWYFLSNPEQVKALLEDNPTILSRLIEPIMVKASSFDKIRETMKDSLLLINELVTY